ncbi:MAG: protein of unknown function DUF812 [Sanya Nora-like virus]|nr:MAG: protein of unknown function DUF812 [Sanya Nora-like virus]
MTEFKAYLKRNNLTEYEGLSDLGILDNSESIADIREQQTQLKSQLDSLGKTVKDLEGTLNQKINEVNTRVVSLSSRVDSHDKSISTLNSKVSTIESDITSMKKQLSDLVTDISSMKTTLEQLQKVVDEQSQKMTGLPVLTNGITVAVHTQSSPTSDWVSNVGIVQGTVGQLTSNEFYIKTQTRTIMYRITTFTGIKDNGVLTDIPWSKSWYIPFCVRLSGRNTVNGSEQTSAIYISKIQ